MAELPYFQRAGRQDEVRQSWTEGFPGGRGAGSRTDMATEGTLSATAELQVGRRNRSERQSHLKQTLQTRASGVLSRQRIVGMAYATNGSMNAGAPHEVAPDDPEPP